MDGIVDSIAAKKKKKSVIRIFLILVIPALIVLFYSNGLHHSMSIENIKEQQTFLQNFYTEHPFLMIAAFTGLYLPVVALNLPGAMVLLGIFPIAVRRSLAYFRKQSNAKKFLGTNCPETTQSSKN